MKKLGDGLDRSRVIGRLLTFLSTRLAHYRGLPLLVALALTVVSFFVHLIAAATNDVFWQVLAFTALHLAIFIGLLGILLAEPLGRG